MFIEVDPGTGEVLDEGERIPAANSLPDIDPDEIYAALDEDTRPYLKLLVSGAGKGLRGRGDDLREVLRRLEPVHEDLARVTRATASRREALKRLIHDYGLLITEVGRRPAGAAPPGERLGERVRGAGRRAGLDLGVGGPAAGGAAGLGADSAGRAPLRPGAALVASVPAPADPPPR